jgi:hypothetical protein
MTDQRPLIEKVLDIAVYAPVGLAVRLRSDLDTFVTSGRTRVSERVQVARWIGEMAVTYGRRELEKRMSDTAAQPIAAEPVVIPEVAVEMPPLRPPFDGYQSLAAAQVVQLLGRLPAVELSLIREYERANRGRRTVLAKLDQLLGAD